MIKEGRSGWNHFYPVLSSFVDGKVTIINYWVCWTSHTNQLGCFWLQFSLLFFFFLTGDVVEWIRVLSQNIWWASRLKTKTNVKIFPPDPFPKPTQLLWNTNVQCWHALPSSYQIKNNFKAHLRRRSAPVFSIKPLLLGWEMPAIYSFLLGRRSQVNIWRIWVKILPISEVRQHTALALAFTIVLK